MSVERLRGRLPLLVYLFLLVVVVMVVGLACACISGHPAKSVESAIEAIPAAMPVTELWSALVLTLGAWAVLLVARPLVAQSRGSPAQLQRFLF